MMNMLLDFCCVLLDLTTVHNWRPVQDVPCLSHRRADLMMIVTGNYKVNGFDGTEHYAKPHRLLIHPLYNRSNNDADIMLIKLQAPMILNKFVALAPLPRQGTGVVDGQICWVSGWDYKSPGGGQVPVILKTVKVPIVSAARRNSSDSFDGNITASMICAGHQAGGKDACKGDSGRRWCAGAGFTAWLGQRLRRCKVSYTAVCRFRHWIDQTIYGSYPRCSKY